MNPMLVVGLIVVGLIAGWLASLILGKNFSQTILLDLVIGVIGAFIGAVLYNLVGVPDNTEVTFGALFFPFVVAFVLIALVYLFTNRSPATDQI